MVVANCAVNLQEGTRGAILIILTEFQPVGTIDIYQPICDFEDVLVEHTVKPVFINFTEVR